MDLTKCIEDTFELLRHDIEAKRISVICDLTTTLFVNADFGAIEEAFINLIKNACAHMPAYGELKLSASERAGHVIVNISDTGVRNSQRKMEGTF